MGQEKSNEVDYQSIDEGTRFKNRQIREMAAIRGGYQTITEHIIMIYRKTQSLRKTGVECCGISTIAVKSILDKCGESLRSPGGKVWSKLSNDDVLYIRNRTYANNSTFKILAKELGIKITKRTGKKTVVSAEAIRDVWKKNTHKNVEEKIK